MLVRESDGRLLLIRQDDHAKLCGEMAARLVDGPEERGAFVAAARVHDNGWREADAAPLLNPHTARPHTYNDYPDEGYLDVWRRGIARAVALDAHVGLLVSLHGSRFFTGSRAPYLREFHDAQCQLQDRLLAGLGLGGSHDALPAPVEEASGWIRFLDGVSLFACGEWGSPRALDAPDCEHVLEREEGRVVVDPWPFDDEFTLTIDAIELARAPYAEQRELDEDVRVAPTRRLSVRIAVA